MSLADSIRTATLEAARLHDKLGLRNNPEVKGRIDVFAAAVKLGVPLWLRPLDKLLGAYVPSPEPGLLVTNRRPLSIQRFTAAHEIAHLWMQHRLSYDDQSMLARSPFPDQAHMDMQEVEANAFAAAFLLPLWLVNWHCRRQGWSNKSLRTAHVLYQLSLRAGLSYEATCWTLQRYKILSPDEASELVDIEPKQIKQELLGHITPDNFYGDVWLLSERDHGLFVEGGPNDYFIFRLTERATSGYRWRVEAREQLLAEVEDQTEADGEPDIFGGPSIRRLVTHSDDEHSGQITLREARPWEPASATTELSISYDLLGPEKGSLSRAERRHRLGAA